MNVLEEILEIMSELSSWMTILLLGSAILECCFGYKLMRIWLTLWGIFLGAGVGLAISQFLTPDKALKWLILGISALVFGALGLLLHRVGTAIVCGFNGAILGWMIGALHGRLLSVVLAIMLAFLFYSACRAFPKQTAIISTGSAGGVLAGVFLLTLLKTDSLQVAMILGGCIGLFGIGLQFLVNTAKKEHSDSNSFLDETRLGEDYEWEDDGSLAMEDSEEWADYEEENNEWEEMKYRRYDDRSINAYIQPPKPTATKTAPPPLRRRPEELFPSPEAVSKHVVRPASTVSSANSFKSIQQTVNRPVKYTNSSQSSNSKDSSDSLTQDILRILEGRKPAPSANIPCPKCGTLCRAGAMFCDQCGTAIKPTSTVDDMHLNG